jgi:hypothetical protein
MGGTIPPVNRVASWHANGNFTCTLLHPRCMDSVIDRHISALGKICHNVIRGPAVVRSNCWRFAESTAPVQCVAYCTLCYLKWLQITFRLLKMTRNLLRLFCCYIIIFYSLNIQGVSKRFERFKFSIFY